MFTLEINGRAVAVIHADEENARELIDDEDFQDDLGSLESDGVPIWNGSDPLTLRPATPAEAEAADAGADLDADGDADESEGELVVVFIVPLDDDDDALDG